ncbi:hypothetical protein KNCP2_00930 [Candidatus Rickettsia kedanie]|uniref:Uncharacterized protein n=1 Tax=Candidatus Rickettsia kedanie TaxID=3115352 RepID=A0ABP9TV58_9RICK
MVLPKRACFCEDKNLSDRIKQTAATKYNNWIICRDIDGLLNYYMLFPFSYVISAWRCCVDTYIIPTKAGTHHKMR